MKLRKPQTPAEVARQAARELAAIEEGKRKAAMREARWLLYPLHVERGAS